MTMTMTKNGINVLKQSMGMSSRMVLGLAEDLRDQPMRRACENGNHALWIMGHLAYSEAQLRRFMTGEPNPLGHWAELFDGGTQPSDDASRYPGYDEVIQAFQAERGNTLARLDAMTDADLDAPSAEAPEGFDDFMGTVGKCLLVTSIHPWHHRGQLADIRRAIGRGPLFA